MAKAMMMILQNALHFSGIFIVLRIHVFRVKAFQPPMSIQCHEMEENESTFHISSNNSGDKEFMPSYKRELLCTFLEENVFALSLLLFR